MRCSRVNAVRCYRPDGPQPPANGFDPSRGRLAKLCAAISDFLAWFAPRRILFMPTIKRQQSLPGWDAAAPVNGGAAASPPAADPQLDQTADANDCECGDGVQHIG